MEFLVLWFISGLVGAAIGSSKERTLAGLILGLILGPIGWLFIAISSGGRKRCPSCRSWVDKLATVCPRCSRDIPQPVAQAETGVRPAPQAVPSPSGKPTLETVGLWPGRILPALVILGMLGIVVAIVTDITSQQHHPNTPAKPAAKPTRNHVPLMTPVEAKDAQKAMLDAARLYRNMRSFAQYADNRDPAGACATVSQVTASASRALSSLRKVRASPATQPMIEALRPGLMDIQSGAESIRSACETGAPVHGEPLQEMVRG